MLTSLVLVQALVVSSQGGLLISASVIKEEHVTRSPVMRDGTATWEGDNWDTQYTAIIGKDGYIIYDLGEVLPIAAALIQADNNDNYFLDGSIDGTNFTEIWKATADPIPGMRTRTIKTLKGNARYLKLHARGGDNLFSVGELQVFSAPELLDGQTVKYLPAPAPPPKPPVKIDLGLTIVVILGGLMAYFFAYRPKVRPLPVENPAEAPAEEKKA